MLQQQAGALRVGAERLLERVGAASEVCEVQHVGEVVGESDEVATGDVDRVRGDPRVVDLGACRGIGEAGGAPHLVVGGERAGERERNRAVHARHEDLLTGDHGGERSPTPQLRARARTRHGDAHGCDAGCRADDRPGL